MKSLGDDSMPMDVSRDEFFDRSHDFHTGERGDGEAAAAGAGDGAGEVDDGDDAGDGDDDDDVDDSDDAGDGDHDDDDGGVIVVVLCEERIRGC